MQNDIVPPPSDVKQPPAPETQADPATPDKPSQIPQQPAAAPAEKPEERTAEHQAQPAAPKKKSDKPVGVIATAVVLFVLLAGFAVYAGLSGKNLDSVYKSASDISNPSVEQTQKTPEADVDTVITETDDLQGDVPDLDSEVTDQALDL